MRKLRKGVGHMLNRSLSAGLASWRDAVEPRDDPMSKAMRHLMHRGLSRRWGAWVEMTATSAVMRCGFAHMLERGLSRGWVAWAEMATVRASFMRKLRRGLSYFVQRSLALGLAAGRSAWSSSRRSKLSVARCRVRCFT